MSQAPWPTELRLNKAGDQLSVTFDDGEAFSLDAEYLRVRRREVGRPGAADLREGQTGARSGEYQ